jgi:hypothetical protein
MVSSMSQIWMTRSSLGFGSDTCIGKWAEQEIENEAKGEWSKKWTWKLWRLLCDIGGNQMKSLFWSALLWLVVVVVACWIVWR